jgi:hypothetical protein
MRSMKIQRSSRRMGCDPYLPRAEVPHSTCPTPKARTYSTGGLEKLNRRLLFARKFNQIALPCDVSQFKVERRALCTSRRPTSAVARYEASGYLSKIFVEDRHGPVCDHLGQFHL